MKSIQVLAVLCLLIFLVAYSYFQFSVKVERIIKTKQTLEKLGDALEEYFFVKKHFPEVDNLSHLIAELEAIKAFSIKDVHDNENLLCDGWGSQFKYQFLKRDSIDLYSFGPNRKNDRGAEDDINLILKSDYKKWERTSENLLVIGRGLIKYENSADFRPDSIEVLLDELIKSECFDLNVSQYKMLHIDAWGNKLKCAISDQNQLLVYSCGFDSLDSKGQSDDIVLIIESNECYTRCQKYKNHHLLTYKEKKE